MALSSQSSSSSDADAPMVLDYSERPIPLHKWRRRWVALLLLACVYLPYSWLLFIDYGWNSYRWTWLKLWPILPGLVPTLVLRQFLGETIVVMAIVTVAFLLPLVWIVVCRPAARVVLVAAIVVLVLSSLNSAIAFAVFRA